MKSLFDQTQLGSLKLKNRFFRSTTYEGMADEKGHLTKELFKVYENLVKGGVGTVQGLVKLYAFLTKNRIDNRII